MLFGFGLDCGEVIGIDSESYRRWNRRNRDFEKYELWEIGNAHRLRSLMKKPHFHRTTDAFGRPRPRGSF